MTDWKPFLGRVTLFPVSGPSILPSALDLFRKVFGGEPDNFQNAQSALAPAVAAGKRGGVVVQCSVHPVRIDFNISPMPTTGSEQSVSLIEDVAQFRNQLENVIAAIQKGSISQPVLRVALFKQSLSLQTGHIAANKAVKSIIPSRYGVKLNEEEDFIFQVNRPYSSQTVNRMKLNSVVKWSVERIQLFSIAFPNAPTNVAVTGLPRTQTSEFIAASVTFDDNNSPTEAPLNSAQQATLLREFQAKSNQLQTEMGFDTGLPSENVKGTNAKPN